MRIAKILIPVRSVESSVAGCMQLIIERDVTRRFVCQDAKYLQQYMLSYAMHAHEASGP